MPGFEVKKKEQSKNGVSSQAEQISQETFNFSKCRVDKKLDNCFWDPSRMNLMSSI